MNSSLRSGPGFSVTAVPARYLRALVHHLVGLGVDVDRALKAVRLSRAMLEHPQARIDRQQLSDALQHLAKATDRTDLGFELGSLTNIATADVIGQLLLNAPTLSDGLARASRYFSLLTPSYQLRIQRSVEAYRLRCEPTQPLPYDVAVMGLEILAVGLHRALQFLTQEKSVHGLLEVSWPAPPHAARYRELKGLQVRFGMSERPSFVLTLSPGQVDTPLPMANALAVEDIEETCRRLLEDIKGKGSWVQWVTTMLRGVQGHFPSQNELAAMLRISNRTLARALAAEGHEYRELAMRIRHERALELLHGTELPLAEIAEELGYSDAANFSRAFRKLAGCSPGEHRANQRARRS